MGKLVCLALVMGFSVAAVAAEQPHQLLGAWTVDVSRLQQPDPKPKSVTITLTDVGEGRFRFDVDIVAADGATSHAGGIFTPDGTPAGGKGSLDVDIVSMTMPSRKILVMGAGMAGHPAASRVFSLSDDGKHMIETIIRHQPDGTPYTRVNTWTRK